MRFCAYVAWTDGSFWIIEIDSRTFNALQQKWSPIEREGFRNLARALAFQNFHFGATELEVRTDCRPLMFILRQASDTTNGRIQH